MSTAPKTCESCGAALDAGEVCDCQEGQSAALIRVAQLPVIEERLRTQKEAIDSMVNAALSLVCSEETVQSVKAERTALNKQFNELESQRKEVKAAILAPYNQFEAVYKECVSDAFKRADAALKGKIDEVEGEMKRRCEDGLREYFAELCAVHHVEWLTFEQAGVKVDMASAKQKTPKKLREQLLSFVARVSSDVERIALLDDAEEIMVEYQKSLGAAQAVGTVAERHRRIEQERAEKERRAASQAAEAEAVKKVEAIAPPVQTAQEPLLRCSFTVRATRAQLKKLKDFMILEGIKYE